LVSLSDTSLEAELNRLASSEASVWANMRSWRPSGKILRRVTTWDRITAFFRFRRRPRRALRLTSDSPAPPPPEEEQEWTLFRTLVGDLDVVTTTRLLGRDPDLYSAIDRGRAEAEFRLAIIPPLLVLGSVAGAEIGGLAGVGFGAVAAAVAVGLHWDAARHQREANALLVDALADGRVKSPSLERFEARVLEGATRSRLDAMRASAGAAATSIGRAIEIVDGIESSSSAIEAARRAVNDAGERLPAVASIFPSTAVDPATQALRALDRAVGVWEEVWGNPQPQGDWLDGAKTLLDDARAHHERYREAVRDELQRVREQSSLPDVKGPPSTDKPG
jgi:hypothetical protein